MMRLVALMLILASTPAHAGFKMFGPSGYMNSSETDQEKAARRERESKMEQEFLDSLRRTPPATKVSVQQDDVDMSGVEWRQSRGSYSGRNSEYTRPFGYRAGPYTLGYTYKGRGNFVVWMRTRRGQEELVINNIGAQRGERTVVLKADDEVFFDVLATGNWELTFEKIRR